MAPLTFTRRAILVGTLPPEYGNGARRPLVTLEAELTAERFTLSGDLRRPGAADIDAGGQIQDTLTAALDAGDFEPAAGWTPERLREVLELWHAWHLNDVTAGCEHQRAGVAADEDDPAAGIPWDRRPIDPAQPTDRYGTHYPGQRQASWNMLTWVRRDEHPRGLLAYPCPVCGYGFGTAWLTREIPADVRARIAEILS